MKKLFFFISWLFMGVRVPAQDKFNTKFGKINPSDFEIISPLVDSNTNAVVLSDIGKSEFTGNSKGWFSLLYTRHKRLKILNNKGFEAAEVSILLYSRGTETEKIYELRANTYNIENGAVVTTKLDTKNVFEEKYGRHYVKKKFTFPAVKAGSIIEFYYTINSDFIFNLQPWDFQGEYPCLWSEYSVNIPDFFNYVFLSQGYLPFDVNTKNESFQNFRVRESGPSVFSEKVYSLNSPVHEYKWVIKNAPPLKEENFTSTINNHISKIEFQLSEYRFPNQGIESKMASWPKVNDELLQRTDFGTPISQQNYWLDDDLKKILKETKTQEDKAKKIFEFIRDNFTCTNRYGLYIGDNTSLKDIYKKKSGSVSEINLLLIAMLRHESIIANPVLMSLRSRGVVHAVYPLMDRFNYVVCEANISNHYYYLDGSIPFTGFNRLSPQCYNGVAWVLSAEGPMSIFLNPDSLVEEKQTNVFLINNEEKGISGSFSSVLGYQESFALREKLSNSNQEDYLKNVTKGFGNDIAVEEMHLDSLKLYDEPVSLKVDFHMKLDGNIIYFNPFFGENMVNNPFKTDNRLYPIEMPFCGKETFFLNMDIPEGYEVEEIPTSVRYKFNENEAMFEYICTKSKSKIQLVSKLFFNKTGFDKEDNEQLRILFSNVIKKQSEQIVFKRIKG